MKYTSTAETASDDDKKISAEPIELTRRLDWSFILQEPLFSASPLGSPLADRAFQVLQIRKPPRLRDRLRWPQMHISSLCDFSFRENLISFRLGSLEKKILRRGVFYFYIFTGERVLSNGINFRQPKRHTFTAYVILLLSMKRSLINLFLVEKNYTVCRLKWLSQLSSIIISLKL